MDGTLKQYTMIALCLFFLLGVSASSGQCKGSLLNISTGPAFFPDASNGNALALSVDFSRMTQDDTRGFTLTTIFYGFFGPPEDQKIPNESNEWLFVVGPGYLLRSPQDERIRIFLHPYIGAGFVKSKLSYYLDPWNQKQLDPFESKNFFSDTEYTGGMIILSAAVGLQYSMKRDLDFVLKIRPLFVSYLILEGGMGVEFSGGVNIYF